MDKISSFDGKYRFLSNFSNYSVTFEGFTYKNTNGFYHIYQQSDGELVGIVMDEAGVHITGWADQHCENIDFYKNGVKLKFTGEPTHTIEWVYDENSKMTGYIEDSLYLTSLNDYDENL